MTFTDLALHHLAESGLIYRSQPAIRWSDTFRRWCVFDPALIRKILKDERFSVPSYNLAPLEQRFGIDLSLTRRVVERLPLAHEGDRHQVLRQSSARIIMGNSRSAQLVFEAALAERINALSEFGESDEFCLMDDLLRHPMRAMISALTGYSVEEIADVEKVPQHFDDTISIKRRVEIESTLHSIFDAYPDDDDDAIERLGLIMVSSNTLVGSLVRSLADQLAHNEGVPLRAIRWAEALPCTALSLIEKVCLADTMLDEVPIAAGDRLRLYLEGGGFDAHGQHGYSDLFFAAGPHKCTGMSLSLSAWTTLTRALSGQERSWRIVSQTVRAMDRVFHFPEKVMVRAHAG